MLSTTPETTAEPPSSNMDAPKQPAVDEVADAAGDLGEHAGVHERADHDEQAGEERERLPLDVADHLAHVDAGDGEQEQPADDRHHRRLQVQHRVQHEGREDQRRARPG